MVLTTKKLYISYTVIVLSWASTFLYAPTLSVYAQSLGATGIVNGLIAGGFGFMLLLGRAPVGVISDCLGKSKRIINIGMLAAFISPLGMMFFPSPVGLMVCRFLSGLTPVLWSIIPVTLTSYLTTDRMTSVVVTCNLLNGIGNVIGMFSGGIIVKQYGQNGAFLAAALLGLIAFAFSLFMPERVPSEEEHRTMSEMFVILRDKRLLTIGGLTIIMQLIINGTAMSFTPILAKNLGADATALGVLSMLSMTGLVFSSILAKKLGSVFGTRKSILLDFVILGLTTALMPFCDKLEILMILQCLQGTSGYMVMVLLMSECLIPYPKKKHGSVMGAYQSIFAIGMCMGPIIAGWIYDFSSLNILFCCYALMAFIAIVVLQFCPIITE